MFACASDVPSTSSEVCSTTGGQCFHSFTKYSIFWPLSCFLPPDKSANQTFLHRSQRPYVTRKSSLTAPCFAANKNQLYVSLFLLQSLYFTCPKKQQTWFIFYRLVHAHVSFIYEHVPYNPSITRIPWVGGGAPVSANRPRLVSRFLSHKGPAAMGKSTGLYSGGGVWVQVGQGVVMASTGKCVERVERAEPRHGAGNHGYGVWGHERDIIWRAPHSQSVVRWTGSPQHHIMCM